MKLTNTIGVVVDCIWKIIDLPFRVRNAIRRRLSKLALFSNGLHQSDSQATFYEAAVKKIVLNKKQFNRFRRVYDYREILEHVNFLQGKIYLDLYLSQSKASEANAEIFKVNDKVGRPRRFYYSKIGFISPTTLRYMSVALDIRERTGSDFFPRIVEIGGGYGGQANILNLMKAYGNYYIYDLPDVQKLIQEFSSRMPIDNLQLPTLSQGQEKDFDLLISNYAFSELPRALQIEYLEKVIVRASHGYMLMNSGLKNSTGRSDGKLTIEELRKYIPNLTVNEEFPKTSPDNYLVTWKP